MISSLRRIITSAILPAHLVMEERPAPDGEAAWAEACRRYRERHARGDKRGMGEALPAVQAAMRARLEAELGSLAPLVPTEGLSGAAADRVTL